MKPTPEQTLLSKKELLDIFVHHRVDAPYPGDWESVFKGAGFEFWGLRELAPTDSFRYIDWKATAKTGAYYVREYLADSYFNLMILYDVSNSVSFGRKERLQANIAVSLAYTAIANNNGCGLILFAHEVVGHIPPRMGWPHFMRIVSAIAEAGPLPCPGTRLDRALSKLTAELPESLTFILSDFLYPVNSETYFPRGPQGTGHHEVKGIQVLEEFETKLPAGAKGILPLYDYETGRTTRVDLSRWRDFNRKMAQRQSEMKAGLNQRGIELLTLTPSDNFSAEINAFMKHPRQKGSYR